MGVSNTDGPRFRGASMHEVGWSAVGQGSGHHRGRGGSSRAVAHALLMGWCQPSGCGKSYP